MTKFSHSQKGSVFIVIIVILAAILIGTLGFIFWNSFLSPKQVVTEKNTTSTQTEVTTPATVKTYETANYSFEYPLTGWQLTEEQYGPVADELVPVIKTANWAQTGMGLDAGGEVVVNVFRKDDTLSQMKKDLTEFANGTQVKDLTDIKVAGVDGFTYNSAYEGIRYHTVFLHKGFAYDIIYQYGINENADTYMSGYETIVSSFKLKQ